MPCFPWRCQDCGCTFEVYASIAERDDGEDCPDCGSGKVRRQVCAPAVKADLDDFSSENNGKGRFNPQVGKHFRHVNDVKEYARKTGYDYST
jgi:putative FmdB family regulatory protein